LSLLAKLVAWAGRILLPMGGVGIFLAAVLDSSFIPLPEAVDVWLMTLSVLQPSRMPYYVLLSTLGSLLGSTVLYFVFRRGEEALLEEKPGNPGQPEGQSPQGGTRLSRIQRLVEKYETLAILIGAILPPPAPLKLVVIAAALVKCRLDRFVIAIVLGRTIRYTAEGLLAVRYGRRAWRVLVSAGPRIIGLGVVIILLVLLFRRWQGKESGEEG
jgi:membrane protein YqaA with SNARE-associated domain